MRSPNDAGRTCRVFAAALLVFNSAALAAEPEETPAAASPSELETIPVDRAPAEPLVEGPTALPDVVVTSNKHEQVLRDIPASISAIDGATLEASGAQGIDDFLKLVPGVNIIRNEPGAVKITIRGISSELGTNATTGILFGNVSFNDAYFPFVSLDPNPFDLYDVEVMKGPQGTLYGASALNGAVRYVPNRPEFDRFETRYFAQYTQIAEGGGAPVYGAAVNVPIGGDDDMAVRLVAHQRRSSGYVDDVGRGLQDVNEVDQYGVRGLFEWHPGDRWMLSAMVLQQDTTFADDAFADNREGRLSRDNTPAANPRNTYYDLANLAVQYDFDALSVTLEGALVRKRFDERPDISRLATGEASESSVSTTIFFNSDTRTLELRATSPAADDGPWSWVGGAFWSDQPIDSGYDIFTTPTPLAPSTVLGHQRSDVTVSETALFADVTRTFARDWDVSLGARAYRTTSGGTARASGAFYGGSENRNEGEVAEDGINPKISLRWQATSAVQTYALVSRGFRVGGIQPTASSLSTSIPKSFKSDTIWNYEGGVRSDWLEGSLRADLTVFHEQWDKPQLAQRDPDNPNPVATYYDNVGGARSDGVDLVLNWHTPLDGVSTLLSGAYARTETTVPFTTATGVETQPGTTWPYAPLWQSAATVAYDRPLWGAWQLHAAVTHTSLSEAYTTLAHDISVFDYGSLDVLVRVSEISRRWPAVSIGATNLLDERGITQHTRTGAADDVTYIGPRALTVRLDGRF